MCSSYDDQVMNQKARWIFTHLKTKEERKEIRRKICNAIAPLLVQHDFIKCNTTFLRIYGDYLLQVISIRFPSYSQPSIEINITPLYYFDFAGSLDVELTCVRSGTGWEGDPIEKVLRMNDDPLFPSFLAYQLEYDDAIEKEKELLKNSILPMFDQLAIADDCLQFAEKFGDYDFHFSPIPFLLRAKRYAEAYPLLKEAYDYYLNNVIQFTNKEVHAKNQEEKEEYSFYKRLPQRYVDKYKEILDAIQRKDEKHIDDCLDEAIQNAYLCLEKYSKTLVKKYPRK